MSENIVRGALRRMRYGNDDMTAHGFRAMARTMIAELLGIASEVIEAQLARGGRCVGPRLQPQAVSGTAARHDEQVGRLPGPPARWRADHRHRFALCVENENARCSP